MDLNINIKVDLSDRTVALLRLNQPEDLPAAECNCTAADKDLKTFIKETVYEFLRDLQEHAKKPVEEPKKRKRLLRLSRPPQSPSRRRSPTPPSGRLSRPQRTRSAGSPSRTSSESSESATARSAPRSAGAICWPG